MRLLLIATLGVAGLSAQSPAPERLPEPPKRISGGLSAPVPIAKPEPEMDEESKAAGISGEVIVAAVVDVRGMPQELRVIKSLNAALDQKALQAVAKWRFKPAMKDGQPVPIPANITISFPPRVTN